MIFQVFAFWYLANLIIEGNLSLFLLVNYFLFDDESFSFFVFLGWYGFLCWFLILFLFF